VIGLCVGLLAYNSWIQLVPGHNALYVPLNLAATALLALIAVRAGLTSSDLGLEESTRRRGLVLGLQVSAVVAAALVIAIAVPPLHGLFADARIAEITPALLAYRALIRIPLGTALFEEFAFRGVLFGAWLRIATERTAAVASSVVFGLWHIRPALDLLDANQIAATSLGRAGAVAAAVLFTSVAGFLFCLIRVRSRSLIAPVVVHAATNSLALVAAALIDGI
jgi:membrane protease YdiL (CAAX protease family)